MVEEMPDLRLVEMPGTAYVQTPIFDAAEPELVPGWYRRAPASPAAQQGLVTWAMRSSPASVADGGAAPDPTLLYPEGVFNAHPMYAGIVHAMFAGMGPPLDPLTGALINPYAAGTPAHLAFAAAPPPAAGVSGLDIGTHIGRANCHAGYFAAHAARAAPAVRPSMGPY